MRRLDRILEPSAVIEWPAIVIVGPSENGIRSGEYSRGRSFWLIVFRSYSNRRDVSKLSHLTCTVRRSLMSQISEPIDLSPFH